MDTITEKRITAASIVIILAIVAAVVWASPFKTPEKENPQIYSLNFTTDKPLYHSNEDMNITLTFISSGYSGPAVVQIQGINARGKNWVDENETILLSNMNKITTTSKTPPCNTCAGIKAGNYTITVQIHWNNTIIADQTIAVEIRQ